MPRAEIEVGINGARFDKGLEDLRKKAASFNESMSRGGKGGFFDLEGEKRVERNLGSLVQQLASAENATQAFAASLDRLENVFQSSLGASVAVGAITTLIQLVQKAKEEFRQFQQAGVDAAMAVGKALGEGNAVAALDGALARLKAINAEQEKSGNWWNQLKEVTAAAFGGPSSADIQVERNRQKSEQGAIADAAINEKIHQDVMNGLKAEADFQERVRQEQEEAAAKVRAEIAKIRAGDQKEIADLIKWERQQKDQFHADEMRKVKEVVDFEKKQKEEFFKWQAEEAGKAPAAAQLPGANMDALNAEMNLRNAQGMQDKVEQGKTRADRLGQWTLPEQRAIERNEARNADKRAGILARDFARDKFKKRIDDLNADERAQMEKFKQGVLGKGGWEKDVADASKALGEINKRIDKLQQKIGIK